MLIECPHCRKSYNVLEDRIKKFGNHVVFPCPACKGKIEICLTAKQAEPAAPTRPGAQRPGGAISDVLKKRILGSIKALPPMPQVAQRARQLTADDNASLSKLAALIQTDQAITARVLKLANSSCYGVSGRVTSIQHASVVLGMKTLNELLTIACASSLLGSKLEGYGLSSGDLWRHSLAVAGCAQSIASKKHSGLMEDAFTAGLIHDCGKLILDRYVFECKASFENYTTVGRQSYLEAEKNLFGFDHAQIAAVVCDKWQIPKKLINAIEYHHNPSLLRTDELAYIVHVADTIALMTGIGLGSDGMRYQLDPKALAFLGLDNKQVRIFMAEMTEYVAQMTSDL